MKIPAMFLTVFCLCSLNAIASERPSEEGGSAQCYIGTDFCDPLAQSEDLNACYYDVGMQKGSWKESSTGQCIIIGQDEG